MGRSLRLTGPTLSEGVHADKAEIIATSCVYKAGMYNLKANRALKNYSTMTGESQGDVWPLPKFYFKVKFGSQGNTMSFQEVSGLDTEPQPIEYRHGDSQQFSTIKMPGIKKCGNVTLKKGVYVKDNNFIEWYNAIKMNTISRETVTIQLLDEGGEPVMTWKLTNAWPNKISSLDLKSDANEVAVERLELVHEGLTIVPDNV